MCIIKELKINFREENERLEVARPGLRRRFPAFSRTCLATFIKARDSSGKVGYLSWRCSQEQPSKWVKNLHMLSSLWCTTAAPGSNRRLHYSWWLESRGGRADEENTAVMTTEAECKSNSKTLIFGIVSLLKIMPTSFIIEAVIIQNY